MVGAMSGSVQQSSPQHLAAPPMQPQQQQQHQSPHSRALHPHHHAAGPLDPRLGSSTSAPDSPAAGNSTSSTNTPSAFATHSHSTDRPDHASPVHRYAPSNRDSKSESMTGNTYANSNPYYHYSTPPSANTPHVAPGANATGPLNISGQTSPETYPAHNDGGSPENGDGLNTDDPKRSRACEACRGLKVRCDQDPAHPEIPCKRCAKAGRQCIITQPSRKRQKKADSRVAELEKKLDALTAVLQQQQSLPPAPVQYAPLSAGPAPQQAAFTANSDTTYHPPSADQLLPPPLPPPPPPPKLESHPQPGQLSPTSHTDEPPLKRRRTDGSITRTPTLDGADEQVPVPPLPPNPRTSHHSHAKQYRNQHDPWGPNADITRYTQRSPLELSNRINSLVPPDMARSIFNRFVNELTPYLPVIVFSPHTTAEYMRKHQPILFACVISAAASGTLHPDVTKQIGMEAVGAIADSVVRFGNKSLELVQALQVLALWYRPPERAEQTNFYQLIHMAAAMAMDIGLGKHFNAAKARRGFGGPNANFAPSQHTTPQDSDTLDARRAWLGCYYLCASASMVLRRPNMVRWSNYMDECINILGSSPNARPSDRLLCQHIKISHICEEIGLQFLMDDSTASVNIQDPKVTYQLNVLEGQLKSWKENIPAECRIPSLEFFEHVTNLYLHEIALHLNHNVDDFKLPFTEESLKSVNSTSDALTQHQMAALEACLKASHGILNTMLSFDIQVVRALPMLIFVVRCIYAVVILVKMHVAITTPGSELAKFMKPEDLRVEYYLDNLLKTYRLAAKDESFSADPKTVRILSVLRDWYRKHKDNAETLTRNETIPHPPTSAASADPTTHDLTNKSNQNQTPLHLLSQVATRNRPEVPSPSHNTNHPAAENQDWTFNTPFVIDYGAIPQQQHPDSRFPIHQQSNPAPYPAIPAPQGDLPLPVDGSDGTTAGGLGANLDQAVVGLDSDFSWGSGFEQAMDIAMGGVDGLGGNGLDPWFLGDAMAPFGFSADVAPPVGPW